MSRADGTEGGASTSGGELQCAGQLQRGSEGGAGTLQTRQRIRRGHVDARRWEELMTRRQTLHIHLSRRRNPRHSAILIQMTRNTHIYRVPCDGGVTGVWGEVEWVVWGLWELWVAGSQGSLDPTSNLELIGR